VAVTAAAALPLLLMAGTSFLKIAVVFSLVRRGLGVLEVIPTAVILAISLILTIHVMAPVAAACTVAAGDVSSMTTTAELVSAAGRAAGPVAAFLRLHADPEELALFTELSTSGAGPDSLLNLLPAFAMTELKEAFAAGFLLLLPFLVIDLVVATVMASAGLTALPATTVSLPFKLLLFVALDGWSLLARGLILAYAG
jgi:type III secretion protein R